MENKKSGHNKNCPVSPASAAASFVVDWWQVNVCSLILFVSVQKKVTSTVFERVVEVKCGREGMRDRFFCCL